MGVLQSILRTAGLRGVYAGVSAPLLAVIPAFAVTFGTYETASRWLLERQQQKQQQEDDDPLTSNQLLSIPNVMLAGACAGLTLGVVLGPFERIKCLLQVRTGTSGSTTMRSMVQECYTTGGVRSILRGTGLTVAREVPGNVTYFGVYEALRRALTMHCREEDPTSSSFAAVPSWAITLFAGGMAGVVNWIVAIPIDVVKSRWQTNDQYTSVAACVRHMLATEGPAGFIKGLSPALLRAFPANAATFGGVAAAKSWLDAAGFDV